MPLGLALLSAAAVWFFYARGQILYYGDAEAHLNIARRVFDSRTPGWEQIGSVWLPLPHVLMLPLVGDQRLWQSGLAGSIPAAVCFVIAGVFLFASMRRLFGDLPALAALGVFALNPNLLYLQSIPMTEPLFLASLTGMLYCTLRGWAVGAGVCALAGTLTRYEGWFLLPFVAGGLMLTARHRLRALLIFGVLAAAGPLWWLGHNWHYFGDPLYFYRGPYSAKAIQGGRPYPGLGDWSKAFLYYRTAAALCAGAPLFWIGVAGAVAALVRRAFWPVLLLVLPGAYYVLALHSAGTPIYIPTLWPHSYYNSRYGVVLLPLLALGCAALVSLAPQRFRAWTAGLLALAAVSPWLLRPSQENWITWKESQVNSEARRAWTREAAAYMRPRYRPGAGVYTSFGDLSGIWRTLGVPLRDTFTGDNHLPWDAAFRRPDLFLHEEWAVAMGGDQVQTTVTRAYRPYPNYPDYTRVRAIAVRGAPVIEIYRRAGRSAAILNSVGRSASTPQSGSSGTGNTAR